MFAIAVVALMQQAAVEPTKWGGTVAAATGYTVTSTGSVLAPPGATLTFSAVPSSGPRTAQWGTLRATVPAEEYRSRRVRISGEIKTTSAPDGAALWIRIDAPNGMPLKLDNGQDRAVKGTTDWTRFETTVDVAPQAHTIGFGVLLWGTGQAMVRGLRVEIVGEPFPGSTRRRPPPL